MMSVWLRRIASWILGREEVRPLWSEMDELFQRRVERDGEDAARRWQRRQQRKMLKHLLIVGLRPGSIKNAGLPSSPTGPRRVTGFRTHFRSLARAPVFAGSVVGTLALGIGGITTVFGVVRAVLLSPLPYPEPHELVQINTSYNEHLLPLSWADYVAIEEQQTRFEGVAAIAGGQATYSRDSGSDRMFVHLVTPGLFPLLGVQPIHGRLFSVEEGNLGAPPVVVLGWEFWRREFGGDPARLGETIRIDGDEVPVVGVLPAQVGPSLEDADIIFPLQMAPPQRRGPFFLTVLGRLGDGVGPEAASAELAAINRRIFPIWRDSWSDQESIWVMTDLKTRVVGDVGPSLLVVLGAAAFLLVMVCANAASLLLARILDRRRELAVRAAVGASRGNLVAHLFTESGTLVVLGSLSGLGLTILGLRLSTDLGAAFLPRASEVGLTGPVLLFFVAISMVSLVAFGLLPALKAPGDRVSEGLREGGARIGSSTWTGRVRNLLVMTQFAVSVPILVGGGLLGASFLILTRVDPGFDADRVLALDVALPAESGRGNQELSQNWDQLLQEIGSLPGVARAGLGRGRPPDNHPFTNNFVLDDRPVAEGETQPSVPWVFASEAYFDALGSRLVAGRMFGPVADDAPGVALVDEAFARRFFSGPEDAVGRRFVSGGCTGEDCPRTTIIGVMEEVRYAGLEGSNPGVVFLDSQGSPSVSSTIVVRAEAGMDPVTLLPLVRDAVWHLDSRAAVSGVATGQDLLSRNLRVPRYLAALVGSFGGLSLLLAVIGIYGVMDYFVRLHRRDMGVRIALGGEPSHVLRLVLRKGMMLAVVGMGIGLVAALGLSRFMASLLHGIAPSDPRVLSCVLTGMVFVALLACLGPAWRASSVPPRDVLVEE